MLTYICGVKIEDAIQQKEFQNEYVKLAINLMYTSSSLNIHQQRYFRQFGLTVPQYNILRILRGQKENPIGVNNLSGRMIDQTSNTSRLVEKLRIKGLVDRQVCESDRRQAEVRITQKGLDLLEAIDVTISDVDNLFTGLNKEEAAQLNDLLDKLRSGDAFQ